MWFTGRVNRSATVLVSEPSHVTGLPREAGALPARLSGAAFEPPDGAGPESTDAAGFATGFAADVRGDGAPGEAGAVVGAPAEGEAAEEEVEEEVEEACGPAPSPRTPVPSPHAVRESAARTTVAAAAPRRAEF
jgi:hypothetical protein